MLAFGQPSADVRAPAESNFVMPDNDLAILVVANDVQGRMMMSTALRMRGYVVIPAETAGQALRLTQQQRNRIRLVLTDVVLRGTSGLELAARLRGLVADLKVIYISGKTDVVSINGKLDDVSDSLERPFSVPDLIGKVSGLLDAPREVRSTVV